jgi:hypothetical protein
VFSLIDANDANALWQCELNLLASDKMLRFKMLFQEDIKALWSETKEMRRLPYITNVQCFRQAGQ